MGRPKASGSRKVRGQNAKAQSLASVIQETFRLWHGMRCGQYSVEEHRKVEELTYAPCATRERGISVRP
jgi:hypothetical protein